MSSSGKRLKLKSFSMAAFEQIHRLSFFFTFVSDNYDQISGDHSIIHVNKLNLLIFCKQTDIL